MELGRYGVREILNAQIIDYVTDKPVMYMDYANTATNEWTSETTYATGGAGAPRRIAFNGERQSTLTIETQIFSLKHLALLAGRNIEKGQQQLFKREVLTLVSDGSGGQVVNVSKAPLNTASVSVFTYVNGETTEELEVAEITDKAIKVSGGTVGDEVEVFYQWKSAANTPKVIFTAKDFPKYCKIVGDTVFADEVAGDMAAAQIHYYKAKLQPNFSLNLANSGDPTSISLTFDIFPVKVDGVDTLADITVYDEDAE